MAFKAPNPTDFRREVLFDVWSLIAEKVEQRARDVTPSRALAENLRVEIDFGRFDAGTIIGGIVYDHYWAVMLHDGHGPIQPKNGRFLVYYSNPDNDPRIQPVPHGYPTRVRQRRFLNSQDWAKINAENARRRASGGPPFAYIVKSSGPFDGYHWLEPTTPYPVGMGRMSEVVANEAQDVFARAVLRRLPRGPKTATWKLR